jgi:glycosyltransferase involved in cell wall biosynthesis
MSYYPNVIFYRHEKYSWIDDYLVEFQNKLKFTIYVSKSNNNLKKLYNNSTYNLFITFGNDKEEYINDVLNVLPKRFMNKWIHYKEIPDFETFNNEINAKYIDNVIKPRVHIRPDFSIFTNCFNSYEKILRAYNSVLKQTLIDWEWVIVDDSTDENHFNFIKDKLNDTRIRMYKRSSNSGCIGNVKNESISLCRGKYLLELDHDDEIIEDLLLNAKDVFETNNEIGFIYTDFININEGGGNYLFNNGGSICAGYGCYYLQKYKNNWVYVYITPNINNITLSCLLCCPNHARIWRRDVLMKMENFSEELPICDDYEILLRTAINTKIAKINKLGYVQYINNNENNFSLIRNREINRIGPYFISPMFYDRFKINEHMKTLDAHED